MNMLAEIFDDILEKIKNPNLEHPLFYRCPIGIRFEIGGEVPLFLESKDSEEKVLNNEYIELTFLRAKRIYDELPQSPDILRIDIYSDEAEQGNEQQSVRRMLKKILPASHEEHRINRDTEDGQGIVHELYWDLSRIDFSPDLLLKEIIKADIGGISALVSSVYFANKEEVFLFHIYDDRGADLVAEDKKTLYPIYQKWNQWILDYDRKRIDSLFLE